MRLLRCHIDNFGKLTDFTMDFTENPQVFYEPNGWGKSTFAAFIKVMFYGFANESKRGATLEKERVRYKPWQGGVYGGEILFEAEGKRYLLNRTFGNKEAEDTFALYDATTNLRSEDYTVHIGEELFQINQESFLRTVFLAQNDCDTATTDSINAKIGNLADNLDDINNYEKVQQVLKDLRNSMSPTRKTGSLKKKKETIAELKDELRKSAAIEIAVTEIEEKVVGSVLEREHLQAERKTMQETWETLTRRKAVEAKKTHYDSIVAQCQEKKCLVAERLAGMGGQVPDKEELSAMQGQYKLCQEKESEALANALQEVEAERLSRLRERFAKEVPDTEMLKQVREKVSRLEQLRLEAARKALDENEVLEKHRLEEQFFGQNGMSQGPEVCLKTLERQLDESLSHMSSYIDRKNGLGAKRATLSSLKIMEQQQNAQRQQQMQQSIQQMKERQEVQRKTQIATVAILIVGVGFLVAGGGLLALSNQVLGIVLLCVGMVAAVLSGVMLMVGRKGRPSAQDELEIGGRGRVADEVLWQETTSVNADIGMLEQEIARDEEQMYESREFVSALLNDLAGAAAAEWCADSAWENPLWLRDKLYACKDELKTLQRLWAKETDYQVKGYPAQIKDLQAQITEVLEPFCGQFDINDAGEVLSALAENRERFVALESREMKFQAAKAETDEYQQVLTDFLAKYGQSTASLYDGLQKLADNLKDYENACQELVRLEAQKQDFEANNDIDAFGQNVPKGESEEELKERMDALDESISSLNEQIHGYRRQLEERKEELEELALQKERLAQAEADYDKDYIYYNRIGYVSEYLEKAKESLSAKYIGPVFDSFKRNYELISGESGEDFRMDANIHVTKRDLGEQRETGAFSAGNRDLINIVLRMALVDAMYQKEKPFLVIDDAFVNLDGERLETAAKFLKQLAKDYQVIYFTCHESRVLTD